MRELSTQAFLQAMDICVQDTVDFLLFSGDLFNTSLPSLDTLKMVTKKLKELNDRQIPVYVIAGSHDFSPSGKTMIDVLEQAGLLKNVCRGTVHPETRQLHLHFTVDKKTGAKLTGILGRKGQLDRAYYENLALEHLEREPGYKIFLFHTTLSEMKPVHLQQVESHPVSFLPRRFGYYAGGHIHHRTEISLPDYGTLTYPGALFPNSFAEVEKYGHGGFYMIAVEEGKQTLEWIPVKMREQVALQVDCTGKSPEQVQQFLEATAPQVQGKLVTLRFQGRLSTGRISDIPFSDIQEKLYGAGAYFVLRNTAEVQAEVLGEIKMIPEHPEALEEQIIQEHLRGSFFDREKELHLMRSLLTAFHIQKKEGETVTDFQRRVEQEGDQIISNYFPEQAPDRKL